VAVVAAVGAVSAGVLGPPAPAGAAVERGQGFVATVDGHRSWYGSYRLGDHGEVWCVDHGVPAPDVVLGYEPTDLDDRAPDTRRAIAWAVGRHGAGADPVTAAALKLVLHDLMGARYPSGPLSVDRLGPGDLSGFGGREAEVVGRARSIKADAVARAHLAGPLVLRAEAEPVPAGGEGVLTATLTDVEGRPLAGVAVHPTVTGAELGGEVGRTTDEAGRARWTYRAAAGANTFALSADVPGAELFALRPTAGVAQRVVRPASASVAAETWFEGVARRRVVIHKRGDAEPGLPVAGARFSLGGHEVVAGADGRTPPVDLPPGSYELIELEAPPGYEVGGPWTVEVAGDDVVFEVMDVARRGWLDLVKVDAATGEVLAGATFAVAADRDADPTTFEAPVPDPTAALLPGRYEVREVTAPAGYRRVEEPTVAEVRAGERTVVRLANEALPVEVPPPAAPAEPAPAEPAPTEPAPAAPAPAEAPIVAAQTLDAPPPSAAVPPTPTSAPPEPPRPAELPRTGVPLARLAGLGLVLAGAGLLLTTAAASSSGTPGRPAPRPRRPAATDGTCRP
jgi:hypothetical protein